jgi:ligand-binding SRPBCC domain-containing protein
VPQEYVLERTQTIFQPLEQVFAFFADAANLEAITPPWLHFRILTPLPIAMREGALIDYTIRLYGVPLRWRTRIETWEPMSRFVDNQLSGPYALWHHTHTFTPTDEGVEMVDRVRYAIPLGPLGEMARRLFVDRLLEAIFDYRRDQIVKLLPALPPVPHA